MFCLRKKNIYILYRKLLGHRDSIAKVVHIYKVSSEFIKVPGCPNSCRQLSLLLLYYFDILFLLFVDWNYDTLVKEPPGSDTEKERNVI